MIIKYILKKILAATKGKIKHQKFFERLHRLSLDGMNLGNGSDVDTSGESYVLQYVYDKTKVLDDNVIIFDVGANIGNYSMLLYYTFKKRPKIFAFEPSSKTYQKLVSQVDSVSEINTYNLALGDVDSRVKLYANEEGSVLASLYPRKLDHFDLHFTITEDITVQTLDSFCLENDITHIHFLKMDVEGHEIKVLKGAENMLVSGNIDFIQFEFGGCNIDSKTYFQDFYYMLKDKYRIYRIVKDGLYEIEKYDERYEIFVTTNYLAEKR